MNVIIGTKRLLLRTWLSKEIESFFLINHDPKVIECLPGSLSKEEIEIFVAAKNKQQDTRGYTFWAVELKETHNLIGFIGLNYIN